MAAFDSGIRLTTLHRLFRGTRESLIAVFSLFELMHNFQNLIRASEGAESEKWAVSWYERQLKNLADGDLCFTPAIRKYIKKWYMPKKLWEKILDKAKNEYLTVLRQEGITDAIEKLLEKANYKEVL